jgi:hypothetical protein
MGIKRDPSVYPTLKMNSGMIIGTIPLPIKPEPKTLVMSFMLPMFQPHLLKMTYSKEAEIPLCCLRVQG